MSQTAAPSWHETNQQALLGAIAQIRQRLEAKLNRTTAPSQTATLPSSSALAQLSRLFYLTPFEQDLLTLCAAIELDSDFSNLCADLQGDLQRSYPTFSLALSTLNAPHWQSLSPQAPLRYWQFIEIGAGKALTQSPLRIDERILHFLIGVPHLDERLASLVKPIASQSVLVPSHQTWVDHIVKIWHPNLVTTTMPVIQLCGDDFLTKVAIAAQACSQLGFTIHTLAAGALPTNPTDLYLLQRLWQREAILSRSALLIALDDLETTDPARDAAIHRFLEDLTTPIFLSSRDRLRARQRPFMHVDVKHPDPPEQALLWQNSLQIDSDSSAVNRVVAQFNLTPLAIETVCTEAISARSSDEQLESEQDLGDRLWQLCRIQARPRMDDLAQRIDSNSTWDDLVLPEAQKQTLQSIATHVKHRAMVYETWGFANKSGRGLGIAALFAGASGTGKTMAADVLAKELKLDLYRIDLSQMVSKYIGETEKNLRRVFDAAETGGVILLFDEADALFGKRSEVKDSHDRYANMEVSYLLQRMESYRGLAILTTNLKEAIDIAFLRRLRFVVKFPFPDATQRAEIWRRVFPAQTPTQNLDYTKLARLNVAGGNIRNIALSAAFLAAEANEPVQMAHILVAAQNEYIKLERNLTEAEVRGWA